MFTAHRVSAMCDVIVKRVAEFVEQSLFVSSVLFLPYYYRTYLITISYYADCTTVFRISINVF